MVVRIGSENSDNDDPSSPERLWSGMNIISKMERRTPSSVIRDFCRPSSAICHPVLIGKNSTLSPENTYLWDDNL
jgi:hypothetical protein